MNDVQVAAGRGTFRWIAVAVLVLGAAIVAAPVAGAQEDEEPAGKITIVQTPTGEPSECLFPALPVVSSEETDTEFIVTVRLTAPACAGGTAWAAIYAMPGNGQAWPQTLLESESFPLDRPGTTVITFSKDCGPVQFDVLSGPPPSVLNLPTEAPVLTPGDPNLSARQWPGGGPNCTTTTTTTSTTTTSSTTTTTSSTTTTSTPQVNGSTTVPTSVAGATTIANTVVVAGVSSTNSPRAAALALTGRTSGAGTALGLSLLGLGLVLSLLSRRARARA